MDAQTVPTLDQILFPQCYGVSFVHADEHLFSLLAAKLASSCTARRENVLCIGGSDELIKALHSSSANLSRVKRIPTCSAPAPSALDIENTDCLTDLIEDWDLLLGDFRKSESRLVIVCDPQMDITPDVYEAFNNLKFDAYEDLKLSLLILCNDEKRADYTLEHDAQVSIPDFDMLILKNALVDYRMRVMTGEDQQQFIN